MKPINIIVLGLLLSLSITACSHNEMYGVYSNEAEGFKTVTLMVDKSGYAYLQAALIGIYGEWSYNETSSILTIQCFNPESNKDFSIQAKFNPELRSYTYPAEKNEQTNLHYMTNSIPEEIVQIFETYPERLENSRKQAIAKQKWEQERKERLIAEGKNVDTTPIIAPELESIIMAYWVEVFSNQKIDSISTAKTNFNNIGSGKINYELQNDYQHKIPTSLLSDICKIAIGYGKESICFKLAGHPNIDAGSFADLYRFSKTLPIGSQQGFTRCLVSNTAIPSDYIQIILNETKGTLLEEIVLIGFAGNISVPDEIILEIQSHAESILNSDAPAWDKNNAREMLNNIQKRKTKKQNHH